MFRRSLIIMRYKTHVHHNIDFKPTFDYRKAKLLFFLNNISPTPDTVRNRRCPERPYSKRPFRYIDERFHGWLPPLQCLHAAAKTETLQA